MTYTPEANGVVTAIRIFNKDGYKPMAELTFAFGGSTIIEWDNVEQREPYLKGINAYTYIFDERVEKVDKSKFFKTNDDVELYVLKFTGSGNVVGSKYHGIKGWWCYETYEDAKNACNRYNETLGQLYFHKVAVNTISVKRIRLVRVDNSNFSDKLYFKPLYDCDENVVVDAYMNQYCNMRHVSRSIVDYNRPENMQTAADVIDYVDSLCVYDENGMFKEFKKF